MTGTFIQPNILGYCHNNHSNLIPLMSPAAITFLLLIITTSLSLSLAAGDGNLTAYEYLELYDFPVGLLPQGITGYEIDTSTGKFTVYLPKTCSFKIEGYELKYKSTVTGTISEGKITNLKGVSVKVLFLWVNIVQITRDGDELDFSVGIASANFPLDGFEESPQCGCGFDCVGAGRKWGGGALTRFVSSLFVE